MAYYQNNKRSQGVTKKQGNDVNKDFYNPYSFVGLSNKVCHLESDETKELSMVQDVPLKDGLSGKIVVRFKALTPFCIRSAEGRSVNVDGHYFVPGTTIKGMLRNVFEVLTYSNIRNMIANSRYSMRDLNSDYYELKKNNPQKSGFLVQINGNFFIQECDSTPLRYFDKQNHDDIQSYASFRQGKNSRNLQDARSIKDKYGLLETPFVEYDDGGLGLWFFSGFMNNKRHEFLFEVPAFEENKLVPLNEDEYKDFIFIHEKENDNEAWKYWKRKLKNYSSIEDIAKDRFNGIIPCFYRTKDNGKAVRDLGFSFLYRQPYPRTIHDFLPEATKEEGIDLAQAVFGYVNKKDALKGRVHVGNAFIDNANMLDEEQTFILGGPKPTYYPFYLEQKGNGELNTYFSNNTIISGYKRYLVRKEAEVGKEDKTKGSSSSFYPISAGAEFTTTLRFHNLHDYELGALLVAITFNGQTDKCYHSIGYAKPFGYGKLQVNSCEVLCESSNPSQEQLIKAFKDMVCERCHCTIQDWEKDMSPLFAIAKGEYVPQKPIRYPKMKDKSRGQNDNEFAAIKSKKYKYRMSDFSPNAQS